MTTYTISTSLDDRAGYDRALGAALALALDSFDPFAVEPLDLGGVEPAGSVRYAFDGDGELPMADAPADKVEHWPLGETGLALARYLETPIGWSVLEPESGSEEGEPGWCAACALGSDRYSADCDRCMAALELYL